MTRRQVRLMVNRWKQNFNEVDLKKANKELNDVMRSYKKIGMYLDKCENRAKMEAMLASSDIEMNRLATNIILYDKQGDS